MARFAAQVPLQPALLDGIGGLYTQPSRRSRFFYMRFIDKDEGKARLRSTGSTTYGNALRALMSAVEAEGTSEARWLLGQRRDQLEELAQEGEHQRAPFPEWAALKWKRAEFVQRRGGAPTGRRHGACRHPKALGYMLPADTQPDDNPEDERGTTHRYIVQMCPTCQRARLVLQRNRAGVDLGWENVSAFPWLLHVTWTDGVFDSAADVVAG